MGNNEFRKFRKSRTSFIVYEQCKELFCEVKDLELFCSMNLGKPNAKFKTMGGEMWWENVFSIQGWRIQQNNMFKNYRVLDSNDIRRTWFVKTEDFMAALDYYKERRI